MQLFFFFQSNMITMRPNVILKRKNVERPLVFDAFWSYKKCFFSFFANCDFSDKLLYIWELQGVIYIFLIHFKKSNKQIVFDKSSCCVWYIEDG